MEGVDLAENYSLTGSSSLTLADVSLRNGLCSFCRSSLTCPVLKNAPTAPKRQALGVDGIMSLFAMFFLGDTACVMFFDQLLCGTGAAWSSVTAAG